MSETVDTVPSTGNLSETKPIDQPNQTNLRIGGVLSESLMIFFRNFFPFMLLAFVITSPALLFNVLVAPNLDANQSLVYSVVVSLVDWMLSYVLVGAIAYGTFMELTAKRAPFGKVLTKGVSKIVPVIGVAIVSQILVALGLAVLVIPGILMALMLFVAVPVSIIEKTTLRESLIRSSVLTKGNRWRVLAIYLITILLIIALTVFPTILIGLVAIDFGTASVLVWQIIGYLVGALGGAFFSVTVAVTYHDLRVANEGFDANQLAAVFD